MKRILGTVIVAALTAEVFAARQAPWTQEKAWAWYNEQPWIRGCNYMPASAENRMAMWQDLGSDERFEEMDRELALAESIGFNTLRVCLEENGFGAYYYEREKFLANFERFLALGAKHQMRAIVVLGNDCSRPKPLWSLPKPGPQPCDWGYHGGRKQSQHGSFPGAIGYISADDPELKPLFFKMCEELLVKYRDDDRILFWNVWNEPGNNGRGKASAPLVRELFELAWKIDPKQPLAADLWEGRTNLPADCADGIAANLSDIISYHCYGPLAEQIRFAGELKRAFGRPLVNTEWLARTFGCDVHDCYPFFAQERIGCTMWGFVAGKYQTYEPWESLWAEVEQGKRKDARMTKWFHDLYRPSHRPYDPEEISIIRHVNAQMDAERADGSLRSKIAKAHKIVGEDMWHGYRRTRFDFDGHLAWVVEPSVSPSKGTPWTWTMQWPDSFVDRTGVLPLLKDGWHHVTIDLYEQRMTDEWGAVAAKFQKFLVDELGFAPQASLIGLSWGGFFSTRYAAAHPDEVSRIYLDGPRMSVDEFSDRGDPRQPVNLAEQIAAAKIPVLLLYGGQDRTIPPESNCELFLRRFRAAGGVAEVEKREEFGHHPHGVDPDKTSRIVRFLKGEK